jgi:hypothetical protein
VPAAVTAATFASASATAAAAAAAASEIERINSDLEAAAAMNRDLSDQEGIGASADQIMPDGSPPESDLRDCVSYLPIVS